jgi:hypothetical protein
VYDGFTAPPTATTETDMDKIADAVIYAVALATVLTGILACINPVFVLRLL